MSEIYSEYLVFAGGGGNIFAYIAVTYPSGATCTCTGNGRTLRAKDTSGKVIFGINKSGTYIVEAVDGDDNDSYTLTIDIKGSVNEVHLDFEVLLSTLLVGDSVYMNVSNTRTEFLVVHQGRPSSIYSTTFENGTILLMRDIYENKRWHRSDTNDYANGTLHSYLNNGFLALFDANIKSVIKQVKVPYRKGSGTSKTVTSGESGLSCKIFLLSGAEVGFTSSDISYLPINEGAKLSYFESGTGTSAKNKRIAKLNGSASYWWLRSPECIASMSACSVNPSGGDSGSNCSLSDGVRPALVLPNTVLVNNGHDIIIK